MRDNLNSLGNSKHTIWVPEGQPVYNNRTPIMANRDLGSWD